MHWANDKINEIETDCIKNLLQSNMSSNSSNSTIQQNRELLLQVVNEVVATICPNQCNSKGQCVNSQCRCQSEYEGPDCSIPTGSSPDVYFIDKNAVCDISSSPCKSIKVRASDVAASSDLKCRIHDIDTGQIYYTNASFQGAGEVICDLPNASSPKSIKKYNISITWQANNYGSGLQMILFDGKCMTCSRSTECSMKEFACAIDGLCYDNTEAHPNNICFICNSTNNKTSWSVSSANMPPILNGSATFKKILSEEIINQIQAYDPQGNDVTFKLSDSSLSSHVNLAPNGTLTWKSTSNDNLSLAILIIDDCGQIQEEILHLILISCPCQDHSVCIPKNSQGGSYECECVQGFTGIDCETNIDDCLGTNCNSGTCVDDINGYSCVCNDGFSGSLCDVTIQECMSSPCVNGQCQDGVNSYICECNGGYTGVHCETVINECDSNPCLNGTCTDQINSFICTCAVGFTGERCDVDINECHSNPCMNAICLNGIGEYVCKCTSGYTGVRCETNIDECNSSPCLHGLCIDGINSYSCQCQVGFTGTICETNIQDCTLNPCQNGQCMDKDNGYECRCSNGFSGIHCETNINECASSPCVNGLCQDGVNSYDCSCPTGYTGSKCETLINYCLSMPCISGTCVPYSGGFKCSCSEHITGSSCETDMRIGVWMEWIPYTNCSKPCDYGTMTRRRQCALQSTCVGVDIETTICNDFNCKELDAEANTGSMAVFHGINLNQLLNITDSIITMIAGGINEYCHSDMDICCQVVSQTGSGNVQGDLKLFTRYNVRVASGYPRIASQSFKMKFVAEVLASELTALCTASARRDVHKVYMPRNVIHEAIYGKQQVLFQNFGINITLLDNGIKSTTTEAQAAEGSPNMIFYIVAGSVVPVFVVIIIVFIVCVVYHNSKGKRNRYHQHLSNHRHGHVKSRDRLYQQSANIYVDKPEGMVVHVEHSSRGVNGESDDASMFGERFNGRALRHSSSFSNPYSPKY